MQVNSLAEFHTELSEKLPLFSVVKEQDCSTTTGAAAFAPLTFI